MMNASILLSLTHRPPYALDPYTIGTGSLRVKILKLKKIKNQEMNQP